MACQQRGYLTAVLNVCAGQEVSRKFEKNPFFFNVMLLPSDEYFGCREQNVAAVRARRTLVTG